jgi:hypothetical protein
MHKAFSLLKGFWVYVFQGGGTCFYSADHYGDGPGNGGGGGNGEEKVIISPSGDGQICFDEPTNYGYGDNGDGYSQASTFTIEKLKD